MTEAAQPVEESAVAVTNVSRWYGNVVAVNDVTFTLDGGITGLLGPNGAGKSTILHMIGGFLAPSSGSVTVAASQTRGHPELYRQIGLVPEHEAVYPFLTGREFVVANARLQGMAPAKRASRRRGPSARWTWIGPGAGDRHLFEGDAAARSRWRRRSSTTRRCFCWTSRSTAWTHASGCT